MNGKDFKQVLFVIVAIVGVGWWYAAKHDSGASPLAATSSHASGLRIVSQSTKDAGIGDGTFYDYVTVANTSASLKPYVGLSGSCTNNAGTVVGTGMGNTANVAPGEQTVITVMFLNAPDCVHITVRFDALTD